jgi:16S rRNA (guanine527-N7)-methyltransferase
VSGSGPGALAAGLGVAPDVAARLARYLERLEAWSGRVNLTGARTVAARVDLLLRPALAIAPFARPGRLVDVGSGNGSPGLVLAAVRPDLAVTLLEPRQKRWAFLREAARAMGVAADVRRQRHDEYDGPPAETVTVRALSLPPAELSPLLAPGGTLIVLGKPLAASATLTPIPDAPPGAHAYRKT